MSSFSIIDRELAWKPVVSKFNCKLVNSLKQKLFRVALNIRYNECITCKSATSKNNRSGDDLNVEIAPFQYNVYGDPRSL